MPFMKGVALTLGMLCLGSLSASAQKNVLLIVADDMGLGDLSAYHVGSDPPRTPNLDMLAAQGVRFTNAWSTPFCSPSRAAILTGRHGHRTGLGHLVNPYTSDPALRPAEVTIPEMLDLGTGGNYRDAAFGKWHLGNLTNGGDLAPNVAGFSHYKGILAGATDQYFDHDAVVNGVTVPQQGYLTTTTVQDALDWVTTGDPDAPWFCYLALHAPHTPIHAPPAELHTIPGLVPGTHPDPSDPDLRQYFKAMVEALDHELGNLFAGLGDELADTTIVFLADNGALGQIIAPPYALGKAKTTLYQGGVNVPLIVVDPDVVLPGRTSKALVHVVDVFATVAEAAGVDLAATLPGVTLDSRSLLPYVDLQTLPVQREALYTEHFSPNTLTGPWDWYRKAARNRRYKLLRLDDGERFYDLLADPFEDNDLLLGTLTLHQQRGYLELQRVLDTTGADV